MYEVKGQTNQLPYTLKCYRNLITLFRQFGIKQFGTAANENFLHYTVLCTPVCVCSVQTKRTAHKIRATDNAIKLCKQGASISRST